MSTKLRERRVWELTKTEFVRLAYCQHAPRSRGRLNQLIKNIVEENRHHIKQQIRREMEHTNMVPENLFERVDPYNIAQEAHRKQIVYAISSGFNVPWRAVKEYPDLAATYQQRINLPKTDPALVDYRYDVGEPWPMS